MSHNTLSLKFILKNCKERVSDSYVQLVFKSSRWILCHCLTCKDHFRHEGAYWKNGTGRNGIGREGIGRDETEQ